MEEYQYDKVFVDNLGVRTAVCLGRLCRAAMGEDCGLIAVRLEVQPGNPPFLTAERICDVPEADCPGSTLIETAANLALAQIQRDIN